MCVVNRILKQECQKYFDQILIWYQNWKYKKFNFEKNIILK